MRKTALTLAAGGSLLLAHGVAQAAEEVGQAYIKGMGSYIVADDDRSVDDEVVGGLIGFGYALSDHWNLELDINLLDLSGDGSVDGGEGAVRVLDQDQTAINLNVMNLYNRSGVISPFLLAGIGVVNTDIDGNADRDDLQLQAGFGALAKLYKSRLSLRAEMLYRWQDGGFQVDNDRTVQGFDNSSLSDWIVNVGFSVALGSTPAPAAAPVAAAVVAAPPPPPPPPPPPADTDGDGVIDANDKCPDTPRGDRVDAKGCSCDVTRQLQFAFGSADLTADDVKILEEVVENLKRLNFISGTVVGHTDSVGSEAYNQRLSERRAQTVATFLEERGIAPGRLKVVGKGESQPIADNDTAEGRRLNRRVVLTRTDCDVPN
jgi:OOP family OmpA-OmpF porin